jgi:glycosyltransferase involved in cell wall biosynthesis
MYEGTTVAVVVPAFNEEGHVGEVIATLPSYVDRAYVVDDCSTDGTWREIIWTALRVNDEAGESGLRVVPISHERRRGVGGAIKTGYERARGDGIDVAAVMAGDGQMDPDLLHHILDPVVSGDAGYAKGTRLGSREFRSGMPAWRLFGNALLTLLTRIASGYWEMSDPQNGYTAVSLAVFDEVALDTLYEDYGFLNDLLVRLNAAEVPIADVPMPARYGDESSSIRYTEFVPKLSALLLRGFLWRLRTRYATVRWSPVALCYLSGLLGTGLGVLLLPLALLPSTARWLDAGAAAWLLGGGVLLLLLASLADGRLNRGLVHRASEDALADERAVPDRGEREPATGGLEHD